MYKIKSKQEFSSIEDARNYILSAIDGPGEFEIVWEDEKK